LGFVFWDLTLRSRPLRVGLRVPLRDSAFLLFGACYLSFGIPPPFLMFTCEKSYKPFLYIAFVLLTFVIFGLLDHSRRKKIPYHVPAVDFDSISGQFNEIELDRPDPAKGSSLRESLIQLCIDEYRENPLAGYPGVRKNKPLLFLNINGTAQGKNWYFFYYVSTTGSDKIVYTYSVDQNKFISKALISDSAIPGPL